MSNEIDFRNGILIKSEDYCFTWDEMAISSLLVVILLSIAIVFAGSSQLTVWKIIVAAILFVPASLQGMISGTPYSTGGIINLSLVGYVVIISLFVLMRQTGSMAKKETYLVLLCFGIIIFIRIFADGRNFISNKILDNYFLPMILALLVASKMEIQHIPRVLGFMYKCIVLCAVVACFEYVYGKSLFFHDYYMNFVPWYESMFTATTYGASFRSVSFLGHPLLGGMYYAIGIVYLNNKVDLDERKLFKRLSYIVLFLALLTTNSRSALLGVIVYFMFDLLRKRKISAFVLMTGLALIFLFFIDWQSFYYSLFARDVSGTSVQVRADALSSIFKIPRSTFLFGEGYNSTQALLGRLGFSSNFEIGYLIILVENGIIGFLAWISSIAILYKKNVEKIADGLNVSSAISGMIFSILFIGAFSNSFGDPGTLNYTLYILLGMSTGLYRLRATEGNIYGAKEGGKYYLMQ